MDISEADLREMVRAAIARQAQQTAGSTLEVVHASHLRLPLASGGDHDGACLIEPSVRCNHCGYCVSLGH